MATFEKVVRETARFRAVDTNGREHGVVEHTTFEIRVGFIAKPHPPVEIERTYSLEDGRALVQVEDGEFQTLDGRIRLTRREFALSEEGTKGAGSLADTGAGMPIVEVDAPGDPNDGPNITTGTEPGAPGAGAGTTKSGR